MEKPQRTKHEDTEIIYMLTQGINNEMIPLSFSSPEPENFPGY